MTGYTVHTGATEKFVAGWDQVFKKQAGANRAPAKKAATKKKVVKKTTGRQAARMKQAARKKK
jgi:hypothetical protein